MKISTVFKSGIASGLFILLILFLVLKSNNYGQKRKESRRPADIQDQIKNKTKSKYNASFSFSGLKVEQSDSDSVFQRLKNEFDAPDAFFNSPFSDSQNHSELFNDPFFSRKWMEWPEKDFFYFSPTDSIYNFVNPLQMRTILQNHQHMMNEMKKYFEFKLPHKQLNPDSVFYYHFKDKDYIPIKTFIKNQKI